jgi:hypothetical protein
MTMADEKTPEELRKMRERVQTAEAEYNAARDALFAAEQGTDLAATHIERNYGETKKENS